ncbi:hypothetical protein [Sphingobacterium faecium]
MSIEKVKEALNQYLKSECDKVDQRFRIGKIQEIGNDRYKASYTLPLNDSEVFQHFVHFNFIDGEVHNIEIFNILKYQSGVDNRDFNRKSPDEIFDDYKE